MGLAVVRLWWQLHVEKASAIIIPTVIAAGIIIYMLLSVWDQLLAALQHFVPIYLVPAVLVCFLAWVLERRPVPKPSSRHSK